MIHCLLRDDRFRAKPWYKPESRGLGAMRDRLAVMVGYYDYLPARQYKSEGYRLEEMVRPLHQCSPNPVVLIIIIHAGTFR